MRFSAIALQAALALGLIVAASAALAQTHAYTVKLQAGLASVAVVARLEGPVQSLRARSAGAASLLREPRYCGTDEPLDVRRSEIVLPGVAGVCVRYEAQIQRESTGGRGGWRDTAQLRDIMTSPAAWLWRPPIDDTTEIQVTFDLPQGIGVSVPWQPVTGSDLHPPRSAFRFGASPLSSKAISVFGAFEYREVAIPGGVLRVSLLRSAHSMNNDAVVRWLKAAASHVALAYGRFPNPWPQVVVVPVGPQKEAVPFGRVIRDGGEAVQFFVDSNRPLSEFLGDWTATHEFSHLLLPFVSDRWVSEGFATYYQNVLLARSGVYDEQRAWQKLHEGFQRGKKAVPEVAPDAARMRDGGVMKVYWSGAAVALTADVELRRLSSGAESLDTVLDRLQACCLPSARAWRARELFARLDKLTKYPVFEDLYRRYAGAPGFPAVEPVYEALGITVGRGGKVRFEENPTAEALRRSITALRPSSAVTR